MTAIPGIPFHAKVRINSSDPAKRAIAGRLGCVAGITEHVLEDGRFGYGVFIYDLERVWCCAESELEPTGELDEERVRAAEKHRIRLAAKSMPKRIIRFALDMWDFVIVELIVEGKWDATTVKYRGAKVGEMVGRDEIEAGALYELPDGGSLHVALPTALLPSPQVTLNNTRLCQTLFDPVDRVRNARNAVRLLGATQICTFFWSIIQRRGDLSLIESIVPLLYGMIYLLLAAGIARRSQLVTLATPLLMLVEIIAIVMSPLAGKSIGMKIGAIVFRIFVFGFIARAVRAIHRIKKAEAEQSEIQVPGDHPAAVSRWRSFGGPLR